MLRSSHLHPSDLHGLSLLAVDGVLGTVGLVEQVHCAIAGLAPPVGRVAPGTTRGITGLVYRSIHGVTRSVGLASDFALSRVVPLLPQRSSSPERERLLAVINGVVGDHLAERANPLAIDMRLRRDGRALDLDHSAALRPGRRLLISVHGLCMNDLQWQRGEDSQALPEQLAASLGYTPLYLHYNTGRAIAANGRDFAELLEGLVAQWPEPVEELVLIGHSMGGLVLVSACHHAVQAGHAWANRVRRIVTLGSPHHGAPLERIGHRVESLLALSPYSAPFNRLGAIRSAGITDLRYGNVTGTWPDPDDLPETATLPEHVACHVIAATTDSRADSLKSRYLGDGLVPVDSALGRHTDPSRCLPVRPEHRQVVCNTRHIGLLSDRSVQQTLHDWLR
jgi:pimeloyl-ACP methyl ester carboxylesterase